MRSVGMAPSGAIIVLEHRDLLSGEDLTEELKQAFGPKGLGALAIRGVPGFFENYRRVLRLAHSVAHLPEEAKTRLEDESSMYNAGWSFGRERHRAAARSISMVSSTEPLAQ